MSNSVRPHRRQPTRLPHPWDSPGKNTGVGCHFLLQCMKAKSESEVAQSSPTLSDPMDCSLRGSSVHGISQARVLEWGAIAFSPVRYILIVKRSLLLCFENIKWLTEIFINLVMEKAMATHSSTLAWKIPWTEEPGSCSPWGR